MVALHPLFEHDQVGRVLGDVRNGTWCDRQDPSAFFPSTSLGPVQPLGVRSTIIGQRGRRVPIVTAGSRLNGADFVEHAIESLPPSADASSRDHRLRRSTGYNHSRKAARQLVVRYAGEDGRVGDLIAVQVKDRQHRPIDAPGSETCSSASRPRAARFPPHRRR